jgi:DNA repair exonuclease SbcCD nuclease subunit
MTTRNPVKISEGINKDIDKLPKISREGIPIIAIHGNHERRVRGLMNPVEALEKAGFLVYLHCSGVVLQKGEEKVCIQGVSGVPEQYFSSVMEQWNPEPVPGCINIFMLHQILSPFLNFPKTVDMKRLPLGFDLYVCGDLHDTKRLSYGSAPLLVPGSMIPTQLNRESVAPKGFWKADISKTGNRAEMKANFVVFENQRKVYHIEKELESSEDVENEIKKILQEDHKKKPLIRIKTEDKPFLKEIQARFEDQAIVSFRKEKEEEVLPSRSPEEQRLSVQELGRKILKKNLQGFGLDPKLFEYVFELLLDKKPEKVMELLEKEQSTQPQPRA